MKKNKFEFIIDSEFQSQIPALTDEEFQQLEENILSEGEVLSPLIVWGNILVDGHNRYKILQQHPEIPYTTRSISCTCETREDVLAWICKHQLGRRNLTPEQKKFLIGKQYHSEKSTRGGNHGNQYTQVANCQIDNLPSVENTTERIAKENNVSPSFVIRAEQFMKTVELIKKIFLKNPLDCQSSATRKWRCLLNNCHRTVIATVQKTIPPLRNALLPHPMNGAHSHPF